MKTSLPTAEQIRFDWQNNPRWKGITRPYQAADVVRLRGTVPIEHSLARHGAEKLWSYLHKEPFVNALGALTGNQAMPCCATARRNATGRQNATTRPADSVAVAFRKARRCKSFPSSGATRAFKPSPSRGGLGGDGVTP